MTRRSFIQSLAAALALGPALLEWRVKAKARKVVFTSREFEPMKPVGYRYVMYWDHGGVYAHEHGEWRKISEDISPVLFDKKENHEWTNIEISAIP